MEGRKWRILKGELDDVVRRALLAAERNKEVCGLLVDNGYFLELVLMRNKSRKSGRFAFYYGEIRGIEKASRRLGHKIVGTFFSLLSSPAETGVGEFETSVEGALSLSISPAGGKTALSYTDGEKKVVEFMLLTGWE